LMTHFNNVQADIIAGTIAPEEAATSMQEAIETWNTQNP
jgi:hypothetical protein